MSRSARIGLGLVALVVAIAFVSWLIRPKTAVLVPQPVASASAKWHPPFAAPQRVFPSGGEVRAIDEAAVGELEGRVVSSEGDVPIVGAQVTVVGPGPSHSIASSENGAFVVHPTQEGTHEIM